jgi:hypothetical protein
MQVTLNRQNPQWVASSVVVSEAFWISAEREERMGSRLLRNAGSGTLAPPKL